MIQVAKPYIGQDEIDNVIKVLNSGRLAQGPWVKRFEEEYSEYINVKHTVAVNSGTAAQHLILAAMDLGPGDQVIVPAITFFSTASAVIHQNAEPVFADVDPKTFNMAPESFKEQVTSKTRAVVPVHLYGWPCEMTPILEYAEDKGIKVLEDSCQAHGASYHGKKTGSIGDSAFFSFYATKNITTGEGGTITTDDEDLARKTRILRSHGMTTRDDHVTIGYNYRMNEIQASIGCAQLPKLDKFNAIRSKHSDYLLSKLEHISWLRIPEKKPHIDPVYFWCPIFIDEDKLGFSTLELRKKLMDAGVETRHRYTAPLYRQQALRGRYDSVYLPNAEHAAGKVLGLPNHLELTTEQLNTIVETVEAI